MASRFPRGGRLLSTPTAASKKKLRRSGRILATKVAYEEKSSSSSDDKDTSDSEKCAITAEGQSVERTKRQTRSATTAPKTPRRCGRILTTPHVAYEENESPSSSDDEDMSESESRPNIAEKQSVETKRQTRSTATATNAIASDEDDTNIPQKRRPDTVHNQKTAEMLSKRFTRSMNLETTASNKNLSSSENEAAKRQTRSTTKVETLPEKKIQISLSPEDDDSISPGYSKTTKRRIRLVSSDEESVHSMEADTLNSVDLLTIRFTLQADNNDLPERETECEQIFSFISKNLNSAKARILFISGVCGNGKTASVQLTIKKLREEKQRFAFVHLNGMHVDKGLALFEFYEQLDESDFFSEQDKKRKASAAAASLRLNRLFEGDNNGRPPIILLLDEVDVLIKKEKRTVQRIFKWLSCQGQKLIVIAIANTLDLVDQSLQALAGHETEIETLQFKPYTHQQIEAILKSRLGDALQYVEAGAVQYIARKAANVYGDLRYAFQLGRLAVEAAAEAEDESVQRKQTADDKIVLRIGDAQKAISNLSVNIKVEAIRCASVQEQLLLRSVLAEYGVKGTENVPFDRIWYHYPQLCHSSGVEPLTMSELMDIANRLAEWGLLRTVDGYEGQTYTARYRINFRPEDMKLAMELNEEEDADDDEDD